MEKLLHERLRECAERCADGTAGEIDVNGVDFPLWPDELNAFADEIERCYHPKPVDVDGRPWELGDDCITAEGEDATIVGYRPGGRVFIDLHDEREFARCYASDLKRPTPKVLDADGVPCKKGDRVYPISQKVYSDADGYIVDHVEVDDGINSPRVHFIDDAGMSWMRACDLTHERPVFDADGERICKDDTVYLKRRLTPYVVVGFRDGLVVATSPLGERNLFPHSDFLTHREPDSLEKLRDDLMAAHESWDGDPNKLVGYADRLTALIERGA